VGQQTTLLEFSFEQLKRMKLGKDLCGEEMMECYSDRRYKRLRKSNGQPMLSFSV
jgi:hypothetical protein